MIALATASAYHDHCLHQVPHARVELLLLHGGSHEQQYICCHCGPIVSHQPAITPHTPESPDRSTPILAMQAAALRCCRDP
jgi:hypothetical protein